MKVCVISDFFPPEIGGIQTFSYELTRNLSEDNRIERVSVIAFHKEMRGQTIINPKFDILRLPQLEKYSLKKEFLRKRYLIPYNLLKKRSYDVFHATTLLPSGFFASHFNRLFAHKKSFVTIYGNDVLMGFKNKKKRSMIERTFEKVDKIIAFSDSTKNKVKELYGVGEDRFKVIYPGVSVPSIDQTKIDELKRKYDITDDDFVILFVGRLVKRKGIDDLMNAVGNIKEENLKLLIVGDGPEEEELKKLREKLNLQKRVIFTGRIPYPDIFPCYKLSDVFSMPSKYLRDEGEIEGLGIVFLEAQSYGVPVIGTNSGGIPEAIDDGKSGFIVPENDPSAIRDRISELMSNRKLHEKISEHAIEFVQKKFSWKGCVDNHINLYKIAP